MTWLQFIDSMVGRLAWPIVVLIVIFALRKNLGSLAERILELSFGGATIKFGDLLSKGAKLIEEAPAPSPPLVDAEPKLGLPESHTDVERENIREFHGAGAADIFNAYGETEELLRQIAQQFGFKPGATDSTVRMLLKRNLIAPEMVELHATLRLARNTIGHGREFVATESETNEYLRQARFLNATLAHALHELKKGK